MEQNQEKTSLTDILTELNRQSRELKSIRELMTELVNPITAAEKEVSERMIRFSAYFHVVHDIKYMHEELGVAPPDYILRELERLDDRYRQILKELHLDGGIFEKVRREMASDTENRYDHTRLLYKPKETTHEAGQSIEGREREPQERTNGSLGLGGGS